MKYLKPYKLFESVLVPYYHDAEVVNDLDDIFLSELEDEFEAYYKFSPIHENTHKITIEIYKKGGGRYKFTQEVQDYLFRVYQYMREKKWYSNIKYKLAESGPGYSSLEKKIYLRPDGRIRNSDIQWVDEKWPNVISIKMEWYSSPNHEYESTLTENQTYDRHHYMNVVHEMQSDIEVVKDMLLELSDLGYYTHTSLSPMTLFAVENPNYIDPETHDWIKRGPEMYVDIKKDSEKQTGYEWGSFYGNLGQYRELVDGVIDRILNYLEERGYKLKFTYDNREGKPSEFEFINNPTSYQMQFSK